MTARKQNQTMAKRPQSHKQFPSNVHALPFSLIWLFPFVAFVALATLMASPSFGAGLQSSKKSVTEMTKPMAKVTKQGHLRVAFYHADFTNCISPGTFEKIGERNQHMYLRAEVVVDSPEKCKIYNSIHFTSIFELETKIKFARVLIIQDDKVIGKRLISVPN